MCPCGFPAERTVNICQERVRRCRGRKVLISDDFLDFPIPKTSSAVREIFSEISGAIWTFYALKIAIELYLIILFENGGVVLFLPAKM